MKFIISGRNIDITDGLRNAVEDKLGKLEKFFTDDTEIHVTLSVEKERQKIEVTIPVKGNIIRSGTAEQKSNGSTISQTIKFDYQGDNITKHRTVFLYDRP